MVISSCNSNEVYKETVIFEDGTWTYSKPLIFELDEMDTADIYNVFMIIDHQKSFPFQNLYFSYHQNLKQRDLEVNTLSLNLIDGDGFWVGKCNNEACVLYAPLEKNIKIIDQSYLQIKLEQFSRTEALKGINSLGILVEKAENQ